MANGAHRGKAASKNQQAKRALEVSKHDSARSIHSKPPASRASGGAHTMKTSNSSMTRNGESMHVPSAMTNASVENARSPPVRASERNVQQPFVRSESQADTRCSTARAHGGKV